MSGTTGLTFNERRIAGVFGKFGLESAHTYYYIISVINTCLIYLIHLLSRFICQVYLLISWLMSKGESYLRVVTGVEEYFSN